MSPTPRRTHRRWRAVAGLAGASLALAACGSSSSGFASQSASTIFQATVGALEHAQSAHVKGSIVSAKENVSLDMTIFSNGDSAGEFGFTGVPGKMIVAGGKVYFFGSSGFWNGLAHLSGGTLSAAELSALSGRWVSLGKESSDLGIFGLENLTASLQKTHGALTKLGTTTIDGMAAVGVRSAKQGTIWISTSGSALPVEVTDQGKDGASEKIVFTDWNKGTPPSAPKGAETASQLLG